MKTETEINVAYEDVPHNETSVTRIAFDKKIFE